MNIAISGTAKFWPASVHDALRRVPISRLRSIENASRHAARNAAHIRRARSCAAATAARAFRAAAATVATSTWRRSAP